MKSVMGILLDRDVIPYLNDMRWMNHADNMTFDRFESLMGFGRNWYTTNLGPVNSVGAMHQYKDNIEWNW